MYYVIDFARNFMNNLAVRSESYQNYLMYYDFTLSLLLICQRKSFQSSMSLHPFLNYNLSASDIFILS